MEREGRELRDRFYQQRAGFERFLVGIADVDSLWVQEELDRLGKEGKQAFWELNIGSKKQRLYFCSRCAQCAELRPPSVVELRKTEGTAQAEHAQLPLCLPATRNGDDLELCSDCLHRNVVK